MTDLQFIELLKRFFFNYFLGEKLRKKPSLMNVNEIIELYKNEIIKEYINQQKQTQNDNNNND